VWCQKIVSSPLEKAHRQNVPRAIIRASTLAAARPPSSPIRSQEVIKKGLLEAYKFQDHEWRVTPENFEKFKRKQRGSLKLEVVKPAPNLGEWRKAAPVSSP